jgi:hypothetical protein
MRARNDVDPDTFINAATLGRGMTAKSKKARARRGAKKVGRKTSTNKKARRQG